jgi:cell wall-associated NlpC family hydrolase
VAAASGKGGEIVGLAMRYLGYRYVFGGTTPAGFDCSGFVYYLHRQLGIPLSRGMLGQYTAGQHIPMNQLEPGDIVFFSNTYMPGLSHDGIYIGGGKFIHAADESTGVTITSLSAAYWASRYSGATRAHLSRSPRPSPRGRGGKVAAPCKAEDRKPGSSPRGRGISSGDR